MDNSEMYKLLNEKLNVIIYNLELLTNGITQPIEDELIKVDDVAKLLNVSLPTVHDWKKRGKIPFYRMGNRIFFKKNEVLDALKRIQI